jgi:hypothetical protein
VNTDVFVGTEHRLGPAVAVEIDQGIVKAAITGTGVEEGIFEPDIAQGRGELRRVAAIASEAYWGRLRCLNLTGLSISDQGCDLGEGLRDVLRGFLMIRGSSFMIGPPLLY